MTTLSAERTIAAAPERVFALATDVQRFAEMVPAIARFELLTQGLVGLGKRFRETRVMLGREATEEMDFIAFDPAQGYVVAAASHGCR